MSPRFYIDGQEFDGDVTGRITAANHIRTMDGASSIELTLDDHDYSVIRTGLLAKSGKPTSRQAKLANFDQAAWARFGLSRLTYEGWFTRLAGVDLNYASDGGTLTLTFEDELAALMRRQEDAIKSSRSGQTRAQFIGMLLSNAQGKTGLGRYYSPERSVAQHVKKPDLSHLKKGINKHAHLTIKGAQITAGQRHNIEVALGLADELNAGDNAALAMLTSGIREAEWLDIMQGTHTPVSTFLKSGLPGNLITNGYGGVLQGRVATNLTPNWFRDMSPDTRTREEARSFLKGGRGYQGGGAIHLAAANPDWTPGHIAFTVEGSVQNFVGGAATAERVYQAGAAEAKAILDAWGGINQTQVSAERYEYRAGGKRNGTQHNYWDDAGDLAREVRWRLFADANTLYYLSDEWLFSRAPVFTLDQGVLSAGVLGVSATADVGMPVAEVVVTGRVHDWDAAPGAVVEVDDLGPLTGRWLIWRHERDLLLGQSSLTLHRPAPKKAEPAHHIRTTTTTETTPDSGSPRAAIVAAARKALRLQSRYRYANTRPMPSTLFPSASPSLVLIDCSAFVTLVYKAARVPDPNGFAYNGLGNTQTLRAGGTKTNNPQPGDLVNYGSGAAGNSSHVGVYVGNGKVIEMGGTPGPKELPVHYRSDFAGYWTYDLGSGA